MRQAAACHASRLTSHVATVSSSSTEITLLPSSLHPTRIGYCTWSARATPHDRPVEASHRLMLGFRYEADASMVLFGLQARLNTSRSPVSSVGSTDTRSSISQSVIKPLLSP